MNGQATSALDKGVGATEVVLAGTVVEPTIVVDVVLVGIALTPTYAGEDAAVEDRPSVTCSSKLQVPVTDNVPVDCVGNDEAVQLKELPILLNEPAPGDSSSH